MTAHVTQAKIEAAVRAAVAAGWPGGVEIDLRAGVVRLLPEGKQAAQRSPREPEPWEE
jgi:hypothetical protein